MNPTRRRFAQLVTAGLTAYGTTLATGRQALAAALSGSPSGYQCFNVTDYAGIQAAIDAIPDFSTLLIPTGYAEKITATVKVVNRRGLRITGAGSPGSSVAINNGAPSLLWYGSSGGTMLEINRSAGLIIEHLALWPQAGGVGSMADRGIAFENNAMTPAPTGYTNGTCTDNLLFRVFVRNSSTPRASFVGVELARDSNTNVEHITLDHCAIEVGGNTSASATQGIGYRQHSFNTKVCKFTHGNISFAAVGLQVDGGDLSVSDCLFDHNGIDIYNTGSNGPMEIVNCRSENGLGFFRGCNMVSIRECSFAHPSDVPVVYTIQWQHPTPPAAAGGHLEVSRCMWDGWPTNVEPLLAYPENYSSISWRQNFMRGGVGFPVANLNAFRRGVVAENLDVGWGPYGGSNAGLVLGGFQSRIGAMDESGKTTKLLGLPSKTWSGDVPIHELGDVTMPMRWTSSKIGLFGATPVAKPIITGSRGGSSALTLSLLAAGASLGLWTDTTTP